MIGEWPKFKDMNWLRLLEGPGNLTVLPLTPTTKKLTYKGARYFRMPDSRSTVRPGEDAEGLTDYGGAYLWADWWEQELAKVRAAAAGKQAATGKEPGP